MHDFVTKQRGHAVQIISKIIDQVSAVSSTRHTRPPQVVQTPSRMTSPFSTLPFTAPIPTVFGQEVQ